MKVQVTGRAFADIDRLKDWLIDREAPDSGKRAFEAIWSGIDTLTQFPSRGRSIGPSDQRELVVPFGRSAFLIQYRIRPGRVVVARIRHSREGADALLFGPLAYKSPAFPEGGLPAVLPSSLDTRS